MQSKKQNNPHQRMWRICTYLYNLHFMTTGTFGWIRDDAENALFIYVTNTITITLKKIAIYNFKNYYLTVQIAVINMRETCDIKPCRGSKNIQLYHDSKSCHAFYGYVLIDYTWIFAYYITSASFTEIFIKTKWYI